MPRVRLPRLRRTSQPPTPPLPPLALPPGRTITLPGRGEVFLRDTGGSGPAVLLIHGWMFPSDLNWLYAYGPLEGAGYRVIAVDLRGHGRGLRTTQPFRLTDCADDLAAVLTALDLATATVVGYSLGGAVAQLMAQRHPDRLDGLVLCATAMDWSDLRQKVLWNGMAGLRFLLGAFPQGSWRTLVRLTGSNREHSEWTAAELSRGSARDLAEAGRDLGRFNSSGWIGHVRAPAAVLVMTRDRLVPPTKQRALAAGLRCSPHLVDEDHEACARNPELFNAILLAALSGLGPVRAAS
ncbi:MAG TPA: alpha/beta hydrolase [Mycobacteriales bacterium]|nr:alpha/beta hydrolase [Mycobacteriales bacterium]